MCFRKRVISEFHYYFSYKLWQLISKYDLSIASHFVCARSPIKRWNLDTPPLVPTIAVTAWKQNEVEVIFLDIQMSKNLRNPTLKRIGDLLLESFLLDPSHRAVRNLCHRQRSQEENQVIPLNSSS